MRKVKLPPPASVQVYEATQWGLEAVPVIAALGRWAARSPLHDPTLPMSHVSLLMSMQTLLSPELAEGFDAKVGFRFGEPSYVVTHPRRTARRRAGRGRRLRRDLRRARRATSPRSSMAARPSTLIRVEGDMELAKRFVTLFPLPPKVG